ncbi:MAG TPA: zinc ribbon domain-containing protein [Bryobacteraceae bacterium]|nr:zinc ribbon domain-containing protein [Bryobacteraceae bacterium]
MIFCTQCGTSVKDGHRFCWNCGAKAEGPTHVSVAQAQVVSDVHVQNKNSGSSKRFAQLFGLDPRIAFLSLIVDMMLNAGDLATMGMLLPVSICAGIVLGYVAYRAQINWYGDDEESARIKAIVLGLLTAIPTPLPELLYIPAGLVGIFDSFRRRHLSHT